LQPGAQLLEVIIRSYILQIIIHILWSSPISSASL
jgi:hypothetical protein